MCTGKNIDINVVCLFYAVLVLIKREHASVKYLCMVLFWMVLFFYGYIGFQRVSCKDDRLALEQEVDGLHASSYVFVCLCGCVS